LSGLPDALTPPRSLPSQPLRAHPRPLAAVALVISLASALLGGCGSGENAAARTDAAGACTKLTNLESTLLQQQLNEAVAVQALDKAKAEADMAAKADPRWRRLDADVTAVREDLIRGHTATLQAKATDAAAICSPLATSTTTTVP
jgi:hypothetical protein